VTKASRGRALLNKFLLVGILSAVVVGSVVSFYWPSLSTPANPPPVTQIATACVKPPGYFLIIAGLGGFNDSVAHIQKSPNEPWPVIRVHRGDKVNILVCNTDDYSPHGFAIEHYLDAGVALMPHETFRVSFLATQTGTFTIYCNIFCPVHPYMLSGELIVTE
jgi:FtsP/CotA-like multicopper oxidase with cupredoxin domain